MRGFQKNSYATLFPDHWRNLKGQVEQPNLPLAGNLPPRDAAQVDLPDYSQDSAIDAERLPLDYAQAREMQNQIDYAAQTAAPEASAPSALEKPSASGIESALKLKTPDFSNLERAIAKSPYEAAKEKAAQAAIAEVQKQPAWKQALFLAFQTLPKIFNPNDHTPIEFLGNAKKRQAMEQANAALAPLQAMENQKNKEAFERAKFRTEQLQADGQAITNQGKQIGNRNDMYKTLHDSIIADKKVTPGEAEAFRDATGIEISDYDAQEHDLQYKAGIPLDVTKTGGIRVKPVEGAPIIQGDVEKKFKIGNTDLVTSTNKILPSITANEQNNTNRQIDAYKYETNREDAIKKYNLDAEGKHLGDLQSWAENRTKAQAALAKHQPLAATARKTADDLDAKIQAEKAKPVNEQYDTSDLEKMRDAARLKESEAAGEIEAAKIMMNTPKPAKAKAMTGSTEKIASSAQVHAFAKQKGISFKAARKQAIADGYKVQ